jgi:hypothetical protein
MRQHCSAYPEASPTGIGHPWYLNRAGILTCFPFAKSQLGFDLGPPNPQLIDIVEEPLPLRRQGFSPCFVATTARILDPNRSTGPHGPASAQPGRPPTSSFKLQGIGGRFSPVHFPRANSWQVSFYALFKGWLLLSLPPWCL